MNISYFVHRGICIFFYGNTVPFHFQTKITHPRYGSPYPWPLNRILSYQKQWEVRRKMKAIGWAGKTLDQVSMKSDCYFFTMLVWFILFILLFYCFVLFILFKVWRNRCTKKIYSVLKTLSGVTYLPSAAINLKLCAVWWGGRKDVLPCVYVSGDVSLGWSPENRLQVMAPHFLHGAHRLCTIVASLVRGLKKKKQSSFKV